MLFRSPPPCSRVVLARREARQDRARRTPALSSRTIWGYFCPKRMRLRPLSPSAGVAPVGVRLRPPSPSHRLQPQPCGPLTNHRALSRGLCGHVGARPAPGCGFHGRECLRPAGSCGRLLQGEAPMVSRVWGSEATGPGPQEAAVQQGGIRLRVPAGGGPVSHAEGRCWGPVGEGRCGRGVLTRRSS